MLAVAPVSPGAFPWTVLAVNVAGSGLLGVVLAEEASHPVARWWLHDGVAIGFCGGFTTLSTFALDVVELASHHRQGAAAAYVAASVAGAVAAVVAGAALARQARALGTPLEERP